MEKIEEAFLEFKKKSDISDNFSDFLKIVLQSQLDTIYHDDEYRFFDYSQFIHEWIIRIRQKKDFNLTYVLYILYTKNFTHLFDLIVKRGIFSFDKNFFKVFFKDNPWNYIYIDKIVDISHERKIDILNNILIRTIPTNLPLRVKNINEKFNLVEYLLLNFNEELAVKAIIRGYDRNLKSLLPKELNKDKNLILKKWGIDINSVSVDTNDLDLAVEMGDTIAVRKLVTERFFPLKNSYLISAINQRNLSLLDFLANQKFDWKIDEKLYYSLPYLIKEILEGRIIDKIIEIFLKNNSPLLYFNRDKDLDKEWLSEVNQYYNYFLDPNFSLEYFFDILGYFPLSGISPKLKNIDILSLDKITRSELWLIMTKQT